MNYRIFSLLAVAGLFLTSSSVASGPLGSKSGLGLFSTTSSAALSGMGGAGIGLPNPEYLNAVNPAQWAFSRRTHIISSFNWENLEQTGTAGSVTATGFDYLGTTFVFPVRNDWSVGLSLVPVTTSDYEINESTTALGYPLKSTYYGTGGISAVKAGAAYRVTRSMAVGATIDYYFGIIGKNRRVEFSTINNVNSFLMNTYSLSGAGVTLSAIGQVNPDWIGGSQNMSYGISVQVPFSLSGTLKTAEYADLDGDTTETSRSVSVSLPMTITAGIGYKWSESVTGAVDMVVTTGSSLRLPVSELNPHQTGFYLKGGISILPDNSPGARFTNRIRYKVGGFIGQSTVVYGDTQQEEIGLTGGFGLPLPGIGSLLDLNGEAIWRGYLRGTPYKDTAYRINVGINLMELWFQKRIID